MPEVDVTDASAADAWAIDAQQSDAGFYDIGDRDSGHYDDSMARDLLQSDAGSGDLLSPDVQSGDVAFSDTQNVDVVMPPDASATDLGSALDAHTLVDANTPDVSLDAAFADQASSDTAHTDNGAFADANIEDVDSIPDQVGVDLDLVNTGPCLGFPAATVIKSDARIYSIEDRSQLTGIECIEKSLLWRNNELGLAQELSSLQIIGGKIEIKNNVSMSHLHLPALRTLTDGFNLEDNTKLTSISAPQLITAGEVRINNCNKLANLSFASMTTADRIDIDHLEALTSISMPILSWIGGSFALTYCSHLNQLDFAALARVDNYFEISANPILPNCEATLLRDQVQNRGQIGGIITINGNEDPCANVMCIPETTCVEDCSLPPNYHVCE